MHTEATETEVNVARAWLAQSHGYRYIPLGAHQTYALMRGCRELVARGEAAQKTRKWQVAQAVGIPATYDVYRLRTAARAAFKAEQAAHTAYVASR